MSGFNDRCPIQVARITSVTPAELAHGEPLKVLVGAHDALWALTPEQALVLAYELTEAAFDAVNRFPAPRCICGGALEPVFDLAVSWRDPVRLVCVVCSKQQAQRLTP